MTHIINQTEFNMRNTVVAIGKFDGIHIGHQLLIDQVKRGQEDGLTGVLFTFDNPPLDVLQHKIHKQILTRSERVHEIENMGIDYLIEYPCSAKFLSLSPEQFVKEILVDKLDCKKVIVGKDYRFGHNREGDAKILFLLGEKYHFQVEVLDKCKVMDKEVSSSYIRKLILAGDMKETAHFLGNPFYFYNEVVHGRMMGKKIMNMATANQIPEESKILPPFGVYYSKIIVKGKEYLGISNIGIKPTIDNEILPGVETNIFDFDEDIYGSSIKVLLMEFIRPEMKFESLEMLTDRMHADAQIVREIIAEENKNV